MRRYFFLLYSLLPWLVAASGGGQTPDPRAIIEKAVAAQGGIETILRAEAGQRKVKGVFHSDNFKFTGESVCDTGNRVRITLRGGDENFPEVRVMVIEDNGDGWASYDGAVFEFDAKMKARMRKGSYADKVSGLVSLLRDSGYTLTFLGEASIKGTPAVGVKVQRAGMPEMKLWFDKTTHMLVKSAYPMDDLDTGKEFRQEVYYSAFEEFDPTAEPRKALEAAKQRTDTPALLKFLKDHMPTKDILEQIDLLIVELGRSSFSAREKASAALAKFGPIAAGPLRLASKSSDQEVARRADQLLRKLSSELPTTTAVVRLLAARRAEGAADALAGYLPWAGDEAVVKEMKFALASLIEGDANARRAVEAMLKDDHPQHQEAAKAVLGLDDGKFLRQPGRRIVVRGLVMARSAKVFRDGTPYFEIETFDHVYYNRFDDALFKRP